MLSIGITTYQYRFDKYLVNLIRQIREQSDNEIILAINGQYKEPFSESYRKDVLNFCTVYPKIFPFMYPNFRSLSKLFNTIIINATGDYVLILNDDMTITESDFISKVEKQCDIIKSHFRINNKLANFVIRKESMNPLSWFDERFLGIGWEDEEYMTRVNSGLIEMPNVSISGINHHVEDTNSINSQRKSLGKYSSFNSEVRRMQLPTEPQYPHEQFYLENYNKL